MGQVRQTIPHLLDGISQLPDAMRRSSQLESATNAIGRLTRGLGKRPPTDHSALLDATPGSYSNAFFHRIARDINERYRVLVLNGDLKVFDENGNAVTVFFPNGKSYLAAATPNTSFRAVTHGDNTYIVNRDTTVTKASEQVTGNSNEVLIWVREGDFNTVYGFSVANTWSTSDSTGGYAGTPEGTDPTVREEINTTFITDRLFAAIRNHSGFTAAYTISKLGNILHIKKNDGGNFTFEALDGLGGLMVVIRRQVQRYDDLPLNLPAGADGFLVEVIGDPTTGQDNYWLKWEVTPDTGSNPDQAGRWVEAAKPNEDKRITRTTMPHLLERGRGDVLEGLVCQAGPSPTVTNDEAGSSSKTDTVFTADQNDAGGSELILSGSTGLHPSFADIVYCNLEDAGASSTTYTVKFDINATTMDPDAVALITVYTNDGPSSTTWSEAAQRAYTRADGFKLDETLSFAATLGANYDLRITLSYLTEPTDGSTLFATMNDVTYTNVDENTDKFVDFDAADIFPKGTVVTVTVNGNDNDYTVAGDDETGAQVATGIQPEIDNDTNITCTVESSGKIRIAHTTTTPTVIYADTYDNTKTAILTEDLGIDDDELVGAAFGLNNTTDSATATDITQNTGRTITLSTSVRGGAAYDAGDVLNVTNSGTFFIFKRVEWKDRKAGDLLTNPFPSFIDLKITDIFHARGRLGILAGPNVVMSEAGNDLNFFRTTVRILADGDPIDLRSSGGEDFHAGIEFDREPLVTTGLAQFAIRGEPLLTPATARLDDVSQFENSKNVKPLKSGNRLFFAQVDSGYTRVAEYFRGSEDVYLGNDLTGPVHRLLAGNPTSWAVSQKHGLLTVLTDSDKSKLYVWNEKVQDNRRFFGGWHEWTLDTSDEILGVDFVDNTMGIVVKRAEGIFLDTMPVDEGYTDPGLSEVRHLDRRMTESVATPVYTPPILMQAFFTESDGTNVTAHTWSTGHQLSGPSGAGFAQVQSNRAQNVWAGSGTVTHRTSTGVTHAVGYEIYADVFRPGGPPVNVGPNGIHFVASANTDPSDFVYLFLRGASDTTVDLEYERRVAGVIEGSGVIQAGISLSALQGLRIGVTIDSTTQFTPWSEPSGGGTRTTYSPVTVDTLWLDAGHNKLGWQYTTAASAAHAIDNLTMEQPGGGDDTTWTFPFDMPSATNDLQVVRKSDGFVFTSSRPTDDTIKVENQGDLTAVNVYIGRKYTETVELSTIHVRGQDDAAHPSRRLTIRFLELQYHLSRDFTLRVNNQRVGGSAIDYTLDEASLSGGFLRGYVGALNEDTIIQIINAEPNQGWIQQVPWEGFRTGRRFR